MRLSYTKPRPEKFEYLTATSADWTHEDLQKNPKARKEVRSFIEYSQNLQRVYLYIVVCVVFLPNEKSLKGIGQMKWSVRDESLHSKMGCQLFRHMCDEYPELLDEVRDDVTQAPNIW